MWINGERKVESVLFNEESFGDFSEAELGM